LVEPSPAFAEGRKREVISPPAWERVKCPLCDKRISIPTLVPHLYKEYELTLSEAREFLQKFAGLKRV